MTTKTPNRLIREKSPYLLQHAYNPVDWYPWGDEAFEKARREDKPIFLSIGYSTCHWCHVMERESFEDHEVASLMNDAFVCIKVDREERPDIDHVYMTACQVITQSGGWPLTILMTPDQRPFFAGTYIPKRSSFGRVGMLDLTRRVKDLWKNRRSEVLDSAQKIMEALKTFEKTRPGPPLDLHVLDKAFEALGKAFDPEWGGFSSAPKFPSPHNIYFLLRYWKRAQRPRALEMVEKTLRCMRLGGIYDHLGFGFHRYSTDRQWLLPHFEKMLYDQALISIAYLEAFEVTQNPLYAETSRQIFQYVLRDMASPDGAFYSAEDADSEGVEGKFYVWGYQEIINILGPKLGEMFSRVYNILPEGNYLEEATRQRSGKNIIHLKKELPEVASQLGLDREQLERAMLEARTKLFMAREKRVRPAIDDKVLTDWNSLLILALAKGGLILKAPELMEAATRACDFLLKYLKDKDGRLLHRWLDGEAAIHGMVDDYAFLTAALIQLHRTTSEKKYLDEALAFNQIMLDEFWDPSSGGFFFTPNDGEQLIIRKKEIYDGALPSGNSVALGNLVSLGRLTNDPTLLNKADALVRAFSNEISQAPPAYTYFLSAFEEMQSSRE